MLKSGCLSPPTLDGLDGEFNQSSHQDSTVTVTPIVLQKVLDMLDILDPLTLKTAQAHPASA